MISSEFSISLSEYSSLWQAFISKASDRSRSPKTDLTGAIICQLSWPAVDGLIVSLMTLR